MRVVYRHLRRKVRNNEQQTPPNAGAGVTRARYCRLAHARAKRKLLLPGRLYLLPFNNA